METPKKHNVQNTSSTLRQALENEAYLRALELMHRAEQNALRNGLYCIDYE